MTDFGRATQLARTGDLQWTGLLPTDWAQGRTTFGGLVGALATIIAAEVAGPDRPLRTLDIAFVAPLPAGPVQIDVEVLGAGKAVTQMSVNLRSNGVLGTRVHVVAGASRASELRVDAGPTDLLAGDPGKQGVELPYLPGVMPEFGQHLEYRWCSEAFPFAGGGPETARINGWIRHRTPAAGPSGLVALIDAWPPVLLPMASGPIPFSTVRWAVHLASGVSGAPGVSGVPGEPLADLQRQWVWYEARAVWCADGYASAQASIFDPSSRLLAWSEQLLAVYDRPPGRG